MIDKKDILAARDTLETYHTSEERIDNRIGEDAQI